LRLFYYRLSNEKNEKKWFAQALWCLLYFGYDEKYLEKRIGIHFVGLGSLWTSFYDSEDSSSVNGPFWGIIVWGYKKGRPVIRILWFPITLSKLITK